jgi:hypothetical protein
MISGGAAGGADGATSTPAGGAMTIGGGTIVTSSARAGAAAAINAAPRAPVISSGLAVLKNRDAEQCMMSLLHDRTGLQVHDRTESLGQ